MQVDPIKPTLKAPGTQRLNLKYDELLSSFAFNFNLRRYTEGADAAAPFGIQLEVAVTDTRFAAGGVTLVHFPAQRYTLYVGYARWRGVRHSSPFRLIVTHFMWDTLGGVASDTRPLSVSSLHTLCGIRWVAWRQ